MRTNIERRLLLLNQMHEIHVSKKSDCSQCEGLCCTYRSNSMQITPLEAIDLIDFFKKEKRLDESLVQLLQENISNYRLDKEVQGLRRTYTCPFYSGKSLGCSISPKSKPYGCLAFNPKKSMAKQLTDCESDQDLLRHRESSKDDRDNTALIEKYQLSWEKLPIPMAILSMLDQMDTVQ